MFLGGIRREHWHEKDYQDINYQKQLFTDILQGDVLKISQISSVMESLFNNFFSNFIIKRL